MSALEADFVSPAPSTPPPRHLHRVLGLDESSWLHVPALSRRHMRSSSQPSSVYSAVSTVESTPDSAYSRLSTPPPRASPPVRHHGPLLLPKIRPQDQHLDSGRPSTAAVIVSPPAQCSSLAACSAEDQHSALGPAPLLCSPASFALTKQVLPDCGLDDDSALDLDIGYVPYYPMSCLVDASSLTDVVRSSHSAYPSSHVPRAASSMGPDASSSVVATTTLLEYLTSPNPAATLVRTISLPLRDPAIKHFWWDIRGIRHWDSFTAAAVYALPGVSALLSTPISAPALPQPTMTSRHPETEASLHAIYASFYLTKLNAALAISSSRPLRLAAPATKTARGADDLLFVANGPGESAGAAALFGGKPSARLVGLVRSFDRFNTGMRAEGNVKRVEYLGGLAALHHAMREHGCRYGFILTEIELVVVRCGTDTTPYFGDMDLTSVPLAHPAAAEEPLTACLALWALCRLAADVSPPGHAHWRADIGAPAEGSRRKARPREAWMPQPQLAEKREAKRSRGWVWPEDPVGRKELGKRGVRYGGL
ncbi:hypothetical protein XA68_14415 [Ophiocordyceps unilateralis]|uniref:Sialidase n=1 Tax=Ophiocordyceps unilateralis TaxID=268505 RepID=A0A2A9PAS6_OPHUN|nr:hypothetical protein XA68_14415 [Ophiocordyceps unilateralis]